MSLFRKKADPISARSKELESQISALEAQINQLNGKIERSRSHPRVRSTARPQAPTVVAPPAPAPREPVFEQLDYQKSKVQPEIENTPERYNDLGIRKYDILGAFRRLQNHLRGTPTANPKLVSYLAAGSIKGLRPLRYEKRIARNRFIFLSIFFALILWGLITATFR
jgi:transglutaminase-like putative cysteine protease